MQMKAENVTNFLLFGIGKSVTSSPVLKDCMFLAGTTFQYTGHWTHLQRSTTCFESPGSKHHIFMANGGVTF